MAGDMNIDLLKSALSTANVNINRMQPQIVIGHQLGTQDSTWVIVVVAANAWACELPISLSQQEVGDVAQAIVRWDTNMAEGWSIPSEVLTKVMWASLLMSPCPLKDVIDSAHPFPK